VKVTTFAEIMDLNIQLIQHGCSITYALDPAKESHLVIMQGESPIGVLTKEQAMLLSPLQHTLAATELIPPLIAAPEHDVLTFCKEHRQDLRPVIVMDSRGDIKGLVTPAALLNSVLCGFDVLNSFFSTLLDTVNVAVTVVTENGSVSHWNSAAQEMYNIPSQSIIEKNIADFFERDALATLKMLDEGRPIRQAYHRPRPGTHVLINASPVLYKGKILGAISSEQDITQIVRLHEELSSTTSQLRDLKQIINLSDDPFNRIIGRGPAIRRTVTLARKVAASEATILITGESGVGKELFAQAIHLASPRFDKSFIAINCGAIPNALFESELFGYHGGAFTGAERKGKPGKLELAHGGTLFLDEVGELPAELQVKLLRVLQDKCFYRVGGNEPIKVNTRIIAATNRNLDKMIKTGEFREDLYYRLNVIALEVPPLRERIEDIPELVQMFQQEFTIKYNKPIPSLDPEIMVNFVNYDWPGNVRELRNVTERLAILAEEGVQNSQYLPSTLLRSRPSSFQYLPTVSTGSNRRVQNARDNSEELIQISAALEKTYGNKSAAAKILGISRGTLYYKLKHYGFSK